jgi:hypothetical protein
MNGLMTFLLRYLVPLTYMMWAVIIIGMVDHFFLEPRGQAVLPPVVFDWLLIAMWPLLAAVWFGNKEAEKRKAQARAEAPDQPAEE